MIRFEILLPLFYNDGPRIERQKFVVSDDELVNAFGATSTDTVIVSGRWVYGSTKFSDQLIRIRLDVQDTPHNWQRMREIKELLKQRFEQLEIWVTAHRIDIL